MHNGSLPTLEAVVDFYDQGGRPNPRLDAELRPLHLSPADKRALIAFLKTLSGRIHDGPSVLMAR
jgi:cytochrome c peroxidase